MTNANAENLAAAIVAVVNHEDGAAVAAENAVVEIIADHMTPPFGRHTMAWEDAVKQLNRHFVRIEQGLEDCKRDHVALMACIKAIADEREKEAGHP